MILPASSTDRTTQARGEVPVQFSAMSTICGETLFLSLLMDASTDRLCFPTSPHTLHPQRHSRPSRLPNPRTSKSQSKRASSTV